MKTLTSALIMMALAPFAWAQQPTTEGGSIRIGAAYWFAQAMSGEVSGYDMIGASDELHAKTNYYLFIRTMGHSFGSIPYNVEFQWTPLLMESEDTVPVHTIVADSYDLNLFWRLSDWFDLGAGARFVNMEVEEDFKTSANSLRYRYFMPMAFSRVHVSMYGNIFLDVTGRLSGNGKHSQSSDVSAKAQWEFSQNIHFALGYRTISMKLDRTGLDTHIRMEGPIVELHAVF